MGYCIVTTPLYLSARVGSGHETASRVGGMSYCNHTPLPLREGGWGLGTRLPLGSGGMSYCNHTPLPLREGGWGLGTRLL